MTPKRIQRKRTRGYRMPEGSVYIGRPSMFGNPYKIKEGTPPETAVQLFRLWIEGYYPGTLRRQRERLLANLHRLRGKDLACFCKEGAPCHGDVLIEMANRDLEPKHP